MVIPVCLHVVSKCEQTHEVVEKTRKRLVDENRTLDTKVWK
jgi:hypothetical protein